MDWCLLDNCLMHMLLRGSETHVWGRGLLVFQEGTLQSMTMQMYADDMRGIMWVEMERIH